MKMNWRSHYNGTYWLISSLIVVLALLVGFFVNRQLAAENTALVTDQLQRLEGVYTPQAGALTTEDAPRFFADLYTPLVLMTLCCLVFLFFLYAPKPNVPSLFDRITSISGVEFHNGERSPLSICGERAMSTLLGGVLAMAALRFFREVITAGMTSSALWYGAIALIMAALLFYSILSGFSGRLSHFSVIFILVSPVFVQIFTQLSQQSLYWSVCGLLWSLFVFPRSTARKYLYAYFLMIFIYPLIELTAQGGLPTPDIMWELIGVMFFGGGLYIAVDAYISYALRNHAELARTSAQLKEAQAYYTQKEKMAALGQLIAGVAHEINTPMGAIKASSENMESTAHQIFNSLIYKTRDFSETDISDFLTLTDICSQSVREMRNTLEMRRAKPLLLDFFKRINPSTAKQVVDALSKMEICGLEKIETRIEVFKNPRLVELLDLVLVVFPYLNATQNIQFATSRVSKIVFALKSYSHNSLENEYIHFDITGNVQNILVLYHNQMKYGIEVIREYDEDIPLIFGNPDELGQVWSNLIQNALQAMNGLGTLTIRINRLPGDAGLIKLVFKDTGGGIKPEHMCRMFDVFFTTKPPGEGSGLGLNICRKIVEKHGGRITIDNKPGIGAAFIVTLPIHAKQSGQSGEVMS